MNQALFTVNLSEEAFSTPNSRVVLGVVGGLLVGQHIAERCVPRECKPANLVVDLPDRTEAAGEVHFALDIDGLQPFGKAARLLGAVILLNMLARPGDSQKVQQLEVVEPQHLKKMRWAAVAIFQCHPAVELNLRLAYGCFDAWDSVLREGCIVRLSHEGDLVLEIGKPFVYGVADNMRTRVFT